MAEILPIRRKTLINLSIFEHNYTWSTASIPAHVHPLPFNPFKSIVHNNYGYKCCATRLLAFLSTNLG